MDEENQKIEVGLKRLRRALVAARLQSAIHRIRLLLRAGYRPDQPRVPAGTPDGGQWTEIPGWAQGRQETDDRGDGLVHLVGRRVSRRGNEIRVGDRWLQATQAQQLRAELSYNAMRKAVRDVQTIDPRWRPRPQAYETVEGLIAANRATQNEAQTRLVELARTRSGQGEFGRQWIEAPSPDRRPNAREQDMINRLGRRWGCHWCGTKDPGTQSGNFVGDHQPARSMGESARIFPHCLRCSFLQGGIVRAHKTGRKP